jgi:hypothetical protein
MIGLRNDDPGRNVKFQDSVDTKLLSMIDNYDKTMLDYIGRLYQAVNGEKLNFDNIKNAVDALSQFNQKQQFNYLNNLLHPEKCKGVKIPSPVPVPSCSFQLHNCVTLRTNVNGNLAIVFNPFFLSTNSFEEKVLVTENETTYKYDPRWLSSFYVNNDVSLTGAEANDHFYPVNIGQCIPSVYDQYRLVSASLVIKYIGRLDTVSGVIGGAVVFDESSEVSGNIRIPVYDINGNQVDTLNSENSSPELAKYGNFDLAMDSFYHQENLCLEGIRELYFPIDNSYEEYVKLFDTSLVTKTDFSYSELNKGVRLFSTEDYLKSGFKYMIYVMGAPANSSCFKVDMYCNFECLPKAQFLNYLPLTLNVDPTTQEDKKKASIIIQQKPVMKASETVEVTPKGGEPSIWEKLKSKFSNALPSIGKLITSGIINAVPALQAGMTLANTLWRVNNAITPAAPTPNSVPMVVETTAGSGNANANSSINTINLETPNS